MYLNNRCPIPPTVFTIIKTISLKNMICVVKISKGAIKYNAETYIQNNIEKYYLLVHHFSPTKLVWFWKLWKVI